ncbi:MAG: hypothetical protein ACLGGX_06200 [Bdellovibrionia bacterium]
MIFTEEFRKNAQKVIIPLWVLISASLFLEQLLARKIEAEVSSLSGAGIWLYLAGFMSILFSLVFPILQFWLCFLFLNQKFNLKTVIMDRAFLFQQFLIESLRSWGKVILYSLFLLLPGFWKYSQLIFVPFVVFFSKNYAQGKVDALSESRKRFSQHRIKILVLIVLFQFVVPAILTSAFDEHKSFLIHPTTALALAFVDTLILLFFIYKVFEIFKADNEGDLNYEQSIV